MKSNFQKYKFRKYDKIYPKLFDKEKNKIERSLGKNIKIEHVGSTAVPGLGGKGVIDIAIFTPRNKLKSFISGLNRLGFRETPGHPRDNRRIFMQRAIKEKGKERRVHIHLTLTKAFWDSFIAFRNYLRNRERERNKYAKIKKGAVKHAKGNGKKYRDYKNNFLERLTKSALEEFKLK